MTVTAVHRAWRLCPGARTLIDSAKEQMSFLLPNQAQTLSKQERTELGAELSAGVNLPHSLHHEGSDFSSWEASKTLLDH